MLVQLRDNSDAPGSATRMQVEEAKGWDQRERESGRRKKAIRCFAGFNKFVTSIEEMSFLQRAQSQGCLWPLEGNKNITASHAHVLPLHMSRPLVWLMRPSASSVVQAVLADVAGRFTHSYDLRPVGPLKNRKRRSCTS